MLVWKSLIGVFQIHVARVIAIDLRLNKECRAQVELVHAIRSKIQKYSMAISLVVVPADGEGDEG